MASVSITLFGTLPNRYQTSFAPLPVLFALPPDRRTTAARTLPDPTAAQPLPGVTIGSEKAITTNVGVLVLGCIETMFLILWHCSRSTRFTH